VLQTRNNWNPFPDHSDGMMQVLIEKGIISRAEAQGENRVHGDLLCASASLRELILAPAEGRAGFIRVEKSSVNS
jgi:hypothetical protein